MSLFDNLQQCSNVNNEHMICPLGSVYSSITNPCCETKLLTEVNLSLPNCKEISNDAKSLVGSSIQRAVLSNQRCLANNLVKDTR
ncbi:hypothetical protein HW555_013065 [Spodoptera exigua]|uniref:Uncharacterized protein n=1 Tax=Spodoptera exigua TaxID=7107 RepID=A0A835G4R0_SPOEX|nr:hypothetical protein HW555_013065 [Spodoptera exigua]